MNSISTWGRVCTNIKKYGRPRTAATMPYKLEPLFRALDDSFQAAEDYEVSKSLEKYREYSRTQDTLQYLGAALCVDMDAAAAIYKSFRRYSQYHRNWDFVGEWHMREQDRHLFRKTVVAAT